MKKLKIIGIADNSRLYVSNGAKVLFNEIVFGQQAIIVLDDILENEPINIRIFNLKYVNIEMIILEHVIMVDTTIKEMIDNFEFGD